MYKYDEQMKKVPMAMRPSKQVIEHFSMSSTGGKVLLAVLGVLALVAIVIFFIAMNKGDQSGSESPAPMGMCGRSKMGMCGGNKQKFGFRFY